MNCNLDQHELVFLLEGCAHGSHLRQHIWRRVTEEWAPRMKKGQLDYTWWVCWRDLWTVFFREKDWSLNGLPYGAAEFLQMMAALDRANHFTVTTIEGKERHKHKCYRFGGTFYIYGTWNKIVATNIAYARPAHTCQLSDPNMPQSYEKVWRNIDIYNRDPRDLLALTQNEIMSLS